MPRVNKKRVIKTRKSVTKMNWNEFLKNASIFWMFILILILGSFVIVMARQQVLLADKVVNLKERRAFKLPKGNRFDWQFIKTNVSGLDLAYKKCSVGFTGACDDAMLYRLDENGSKEVLVRSLRSLQTEKQTAELLQPVKQDKEVLIFRSWVVGAQQPNVNDKRVWLYNLDDMSLLAYSDQVPFNAIFSKDYKYAAYTTKVNGDVRDLMIVNIDDNKTVSGAKAKSGWTFMNEDGRVELSWEDVKHLKIKEFKLPYDSNKVVEKIIKLK